MGQKTHYLSHIVHSCSTSIHSMPKLSISVPVSLRPPFQQAQYVLIGQLSQPEHVFCRAEVSDCILVTSQHYDSS